MLSRIRKTGLRKSLIVALSIVFLLFQSYLIFIRSLHPLLQVPIHWALILMITFLYRPLYKRPEGAKKCWKDFLFLVDALILCIMTGLIFYFVSQSHRFLTRIPFIDRVYTIDKVAMVLCILVIIEAVRRCLGWSLVIFVSIFVTYFWAGPRLPGIFFHSGTNMARFTDLMTLGVEGIFGIPVSTSVNFICYFIIFGTMFAACGGGQVLIDLGFKASRGSSGGPAKAAVISSGLFGMVSGSATANVTTTGVITIPMMKKAGYTPEEAGAVEAVASTGGQIMPPIMGTGAFVMAEMIGVSYLSICIAASVPAVCYYLAVFLLVTFIAKRTHSTSGLEIETPPILKRLYLVLPMLVVIYSVVSGSSLAMSAVRGIGTILVINLIRGKKGVGWKTVWNSLLEGVENISAVVIPTSACGIVIGIVTMSGLANRISLMIEGLGESSLLFALVISMIGCMLLGMALPTLAAYLTANLLFATPLIKLGLTPLIANLFLFYFGIFAQITPPVCLASFAAAGIAGANSWKTGFLGFRFALVAFLVPYVFVYKPELLIGTASFLPTAIAILVLLLGTLFLAASIAGWLVVPLKGWHRAGMFAIAIFTIIPEDITTLIGVVFGVLAFVYFSVLKKKRSMADAPPVQAA